MISIFKLSDCLILSGRFWRGNSKRIALETVGNGGAGVVLIQLMIIAISGWLLGYLATAAQQGQFAGMIRVATIFICIALVAGTAFRYLRKIFSVSESENTK